MEFKSNALVSRMQSMGIEKEDPSMMLSDVLEDANRRGQSLRTGVTSVAENSPVAAATPTDTVDVLAMSKVAIGEEAPIIAVDGVVTTSDAESNSEAEVKPEVKDKLELEAKLDQDPDTEIDDLNKLVSGMSFTNAPAAKAPFAKAVSEKTIGPADVLMTAGAAIAAASKKVVVEPAATTFDKNSLRADREKMDGVRQLGPAQQQSGQAAPGGGGAASIGSMLGEAAAGAVAMPFVILSSAARHLQNRFASAKAMQAMPAASGSTGSSFSAKFAMPLSVVNTMEQITDWKIGRIEASAKAAQGAAQALSNTDEFVVWEDKMRGVADSLGVPPKSVVSNLGTDERFAPLKAEMDTIWHLHADKVEAYRAACNDIERNVLNVVKEFPNSNKAIQERVGTALNDVSQKTESIPGFGKQIGDYEQRTMMERIAELVKLIAKFMAGLVAKLTGKPSSELSL